MNFRHLKTVVTVNSGFLISTEQNHLGKSISLFNKTRPRGYKIIKKFMLNSAEPDIFPAQKC